MTKPPPRVGVVGVRRVRQGIGEHFARWLVAAGAQVPAFVARTAQSAEEGQRVLAARGIAAKGFVSLAELLEEEPLDALVVASPPDTHARLLEEALTAKLHVLCEKPFVWDVPEPAATAAGIVHRFEAAGLVLAEHCQWAETLPVFFELHPDLDGAPVRSVSMELEPSSHGEAMLVDALSHPLSLLQALWARTGQAEPGRPLEIESMTFTRAARKGLERLEVSVALRDEAGLGTRLDVGLTHSDGQPRLAAYMVNERGVERRVRAEDYTMVLVADGGREAPLPDPMRIAVGRFVRRIRGEEPGPRVDPAIEPRMRALERIVFAFRNQGS